MLHMSVFLLEEGSHVAYPSHFNLHPRDKQSDSGSTTAAASAAPANQPSTWNHPPNKPPWTRPARPWNGTISSGRVARADRPLPWRHRLRRMAEVEHREGQAEELARTRLGVLELEVEGGGGCSRSRRGMPGGCTLATCEFKLASCSSELPGSAGPWGFKLGLVHT